MDASRFPITTPYGQVPGYELNNGWHRGEDRAMPMDTPVLVNGHEIGLSGNSGYVTGPHLHVGRFVGGGDTAPNGGGFHFSQAVVTEIGEDATNGKFVRVQADGASWVYLHLSRQSVAVGQALVASAPPTPASYAITESYPEGKQIRLNKDTNLWGMNYHFDFMVAHPVETDHKQGEIWTVTNKVHHEDGYDYYRRDGQVDGFNVLDCDDYVLPTPPPYVPPAAPIQAPQAEKYTLKTTVMAFADASGAQIHKGTAKPLGTADGINGTAEYFVIGRSDKALNLSDNNMRDKNQWINSDDNVAALPPRMVETIKAAAADIPKPWQPQYSYLREDKQPIIYVSKNAQNYPIADYTGREATISMPPHHTVKAVDKFLGPDGRTTYYRSESMAAENLGYGIPKALLDEKVFDTELSRAERLALRSANIIDKAYYAWVKNDKRFLDPIKQVMAGITQRRTK